MDKSESREGKIRFPEDIKKTKQREEIFFILSNASKPMSAAEIYQYILKNEKNASFAISTVYRVLTVFEEKGYVTKTTRMDSEMAYYEWNLGNHKHYAVCLKCHKMIPLKVCPFDHAKVYPVEEDFSIMGHRLELYGFCKGCRE